VAIVASAVAGAAGLLSAAAAWRRGRGCGGRIVRGVDQGVGAVMGFATASVESLFEQADFGLEFVDALLQLVLELLPLGGKVGLALGEEFFEVSFASGSALVECLVVAGLLSGVDESLLAGRQGTGRLGGERVAQGLEGKGVHQTRMPKQLARG
jgi:hypothetical protein